MDDILRNKFKTILFLDIETVSEYHDFELLPDRLKPHWERKAELIKQRGDFQDDSAADLYDQRGAIYSEFGKVVCISIGGVSWNETNEITMKVKSLAAHDEKELLLAFAAIVEKYNSDTLKLCAHNGKEFDFPYLCRRFLINGLSIPKALNLSGKKPWEILHIDTLDLWRFGDYKSYTSLDLLASVFDIPTSKKIMDGSRVNEAYHKENALEKIAEYCIEDVVVLIQLYLRLNGIPCIAETHITRQTR